ncbi:hypothetical protein HPB49_022884 [Dermacentor silvarum]|uniref:Uncharacterized protein n=1 Tax=Dermacentor silvarum TaxID=543639 RepID=A0ACB8E3L2_DERSI|nr:hypothetical protein HPB49_022884 [Dermacentor silvarum]
MQHVDYAHVSRFAASAEAFDDVRVRKPSQDAECAMECTETDTPAAASFNAISLNFNATDCVHDTAASSPGVTVMRLNITDGASAEEWMKMYSAATNTSWIIQNSKPNCTKPVPLQTVIKLSHEHNHSTESADALRMLRASQQTKASFSGYFETGLGPAEAIRHHEALLAAKPDGPLQLANGSINPLRRSVYWWHSEWRISRFGLPGNPLAKLQEKVAKYAAAGTNVCSTSTSNDCWAVLIVTPIMRRAQSLESSQNIVFVDSTSSCDADGSTATVLLTATKAGAVAVAVLAPVAFMTDNSRAEKDALCDVWPSATQLLCIFHVLQAEWRWLLAAHNKIAKDDRRHLMASFQKILYAKDDGELQAAKAYLHALPHPSYVQRVETFLQRECEWVLLYRAGIITRGQNTNNYSEASVRILKDIILSRTKAYNAVALIEFIMTNWEKYFETRLLRHANYREQSHKIDFQHLLQKMPEISPELIVKVEENVYNVPNSLGNGMYEVRADVGVCSCWKGSQGAFCKHQAVVQRAFGGPFPNSPELTPGDCRELAHLALGDRCPPEQFFMPFTTKNTTALSPTPGPSEPAAQESADCTEPLHSPQEPHAGSSLQPEDLAEDYECSSFNKSMKRIYSAAARDPASAALLHSDNMEVELCGLVPDLDTHRVAS